VPGEQPGGAELLDGFHRLLWIAAAVTATAGLHAAATIRNPARAAPPSPPQYHCSTCSPPVPRQLADAAPAARP
jgi:hypothetical protein